MSKERRSLHRSSLDPSGAMRGEGGQGLAAYESVLRVARGEKTGDLSGCMKSAPEPSTQEVLAGLVERVTYHNAENGFCVIRVKARSHRDLVTVVGHAAIISAGEWITASGDWVSRVYRVALVA